MKTIESSGRGVGVVARALCALSLGVACAAAPGCAGAVDGGGALEAGEGAPQGAVLAGGEACLGAPTREARLRETLDDLTSFGERKAGTWGGRQAGEYVKSRFAQAGLQEVHGEEFSLNVYNVASSSLSLTSAAPGGAEQPLPIAGHKVFAYSGVGSLSGVEVVDVGDGRPANYTAPVAGKVVLVKAVQSFHRRNQLRIALEHGAVGMISTSFSPSNLVQVGTVSPPELGLGPAPTLSIGGTDGAAIRAALSGGNTVRATLQVSASVSVRKGRNLIGKLKRQGSQPGDPYLLVGAHYDSWTGGAIDNGAGVASLLEIAETLKGQTLPRQYDIVFVAYDAEEVGLLGGYDYLRRHVVRGGESIVAFVNFEMTGMAKPEYQGGSLARYFVHTQNGPLARVIDEADLDAVYPLIAGLENVAPTLGGNVATDVQGMYWYGIDGTIAFGASPFYHTDADLPDTVDMPFLATNTAALKTFLDELDQEPAASFVPRDPNVFYPEARLDFSDPSFVRVDVTVRDMNGQPVAAPWARVQAYVNDFVTPPQGSLPDDRAGVQEAVGDQDGKVTFRIASSLVWSGSGSRWVQVRVGNASEQYPRGETFTEVR